ncbi:MAG: RNA-binding protein [Desulfobacteraceae bacterium]|nr:RNA-binding protein [Desulfobacteraceae bacterium]
MNIYIGNISYNVSEEELQHEFESFGQIESSKIIRDQYSGRSKGFGFVEMPNEAEAESAIEKLNGRELKGRKIKVNKARSRSQDRQFGGSRMGGSQGGGRRFY